MRSEEGRDATNEEIRLFLHAGDMDCDQKITKMELFKILKLTFGNRWWWVVIKIYILWKLLVQSVYLISSSHETSREAGRYQD